MIIFNCGCESGIAIFVWRVTKNDVYSPFKGTVYVTVGCRSLTELS